MYNLAKFGLSCFFATIGIISALVLVSLMHLSSLSILPSADAVGTSKSLGLGSMLPIPNDLIKPPNQKYAIPSNAISGSDIPKNLIVGSSCVNDCPTIGTNKDDIIYGVPVADVTIYGLKGNDVIAGGSGNTKLYGGDGNDEINAGVGNAQMYGGEGDDVLVGGTGTNIFVGGPGNDQLYAGASSDTLIGGPGADYFNCGTQTAAGGSPSSAVVLDFNPIDGDTKSTNCKYVFTQSQVPAAP